jgi:hypothetical protein
MASTRNQLTSQMIWTQQGGQITPQAWFFLNQLQEGLPPSGSGFVENGSKTTYPDLALGVGPDIDKGTAVNGDIYVATDTGIIYVGVGGFWIAELPAFTGDVNSVVGSSVINLNNVNATVGTFGSGSVVPVVTVNAKGLVTKIDIAPITSIGGLPGGPTNAVQFNGGGFFSGLGDFTYTDGIGLTISNLGGVILDSANQSAPGPGFVGPALIWGNGIGRPNIYGYNNGASSVIGFQLNGQSFASLTVGVGGVIVPGNLSLGEELIDSASSPGTSGQVLTSTGTATQWETPTGGYPADNVISVPTTLPINTSYILIEFLQIDAPLVVDGMLRILL